MFKVLLQILISLFTLVLIFSFLLTYLNAWINVSSSLPKGIYLIKNDASAPKKGDLVLSCIPNLYADLAFERGYLTSGKCHNKIAPVGKYVAATTGDKVETTLDGIYINKKLIKNSQAQVKDAQGREMFRQNINRMLQANEILLLNEKENSFDSRYFGIVDTKLLIGKLEALVIIKE
ncbi:conjugative transfer signal peptidase TraF [Succinatimonas hippei]|uniref:conjugative transfer signal peptidase TraF n=1 Tax=Succinatimonas hippei TaxID=626938 RepID=UPI002013BFDC|nr:conjugative transfer signal peptidase TraF [Succinatimonas hippei]MCL1603553.1 conjugative transfer signal peptidase TraF [Succinatimonas hippei]